MEAVNYIPSGETTLDLILDRNRRTADQTDNFLIVFIAAAGPCQPLNLSVLVSSALAASKKLSSSFNAAAGIRRMSRKPSSTGECSGNANTRSFRSCLPFFLCMSSSMPMGLHPRTRPDRSAPRE
jgi:hypothetical protein